MAILGKKNGTTGRRRVILASMGAAVTGVGVSGVSNAAFGKTLPAADHRPDPRAWSDRGLYAAWLGHSTVLLKMDGFTVITDPVLGPRCGVNLHVTQVGFKRLVAPALRVNELPKVDLLLLSHAHFDHLDTYTIGKLESRSSEVVMAPRTSDLIHPRAFGRVTELAWGEETRVGPLRVRGIQVRHWGARLRTDTHRGYNGYLIESDRYRVLFAGDTANTDLFRQLRTSKRIDLAIMPIGAYHPWTHAHCNPEEALRMGLEAGAEAFLPVHHQTFRLGREPLLEPIERFQLATDRAKVRLTMTSVGQSALV